MAEQVETDKKPFRFSLRTLLLITTVAAILTPLLDTQSGQFLFIVLLILASIWLLTLGVIRSLERGKIPNAIAFVLLAMFLFAVLMGVLLPTV